MTGTEDRRPPRRVALAVVLLAWLAFLPSLGNGFALDDTLARAANDGAPNPSIAELHGPAYYFTSDYWAGRGARSGLYRPVTIYSFALTHHLVGATGRFEATPHHVINVLLNGLAAWLVLWLLTDFGMARLAAGLTAVLFAVHGLHSEVVATVIGRGELFAFCFGMSGVLALRRAHQRRPLAWSLVAGAAFFLAFGSKESAVAWVGLVPCYLLARGWQRGAVAVRWPLVVAALLPALAAFLVLRGLAVAGPTDPVQYAANPLVYEPAATRLWTALDLWGEGLGLCLWSWSLACLYGLQSVRLVESPADVGVWLAVVVFAAWLFAALRRPARRPGLFLAAAFFFGFGFLTSNLPFAIGTVFGERLYFTPSLGVCMLPALLLGRLGDRGRRVLLAVCTAWVVLQVVVDVQRSLAWRDNQTLFLADAEAHPECALLQVTAAKLFEVLEREQPDRREFFRQRQRRCIERALRDDPASVDAVAFAAGLRERDGDPDRAIREFERALAMARLANSGLEADIREHLGRLLVTHREDYVGGLREAARSLALEPQDAALRTRIVNIGVQRAAFLVAQPDRQRRSARELVDVLTTVFEVLPPRDRHLDQFIAARMYLAQAHEDLGESAAARQSYQAVLQLPAVPAAVQARAQARLRALAR